MRRVLFVTVGTTAITAEGLRCGENLRLKMRIDSYQGASEQQQRNKGVDLKRELTKAHNHFWQSLFPPPGEAHLNHRHAQPDPQHYQNTSAELVTTFGLIGSKEPEVQGLLGNPGDAAVLLASNTAEGKLAAEVNAQVIHDMLLGETCACKGDVQYCERIVVKPVPGLEPAKDKFEGLLQGLLTAVQPYKGLQAAFNVTGGFKGVIPYITWLTFENFKNAPMYYQHEKMTTFARIRFSPDPNPKPEEPRTVPSAYPEPVYLRAARLQP
jgi:CRISPR-associated protein (Cas_APE2256)